YLVRLRSALRLLPTRRSSDLDHRVPRNRSRYILGLNALRIEDLADGVGHLGRVHDGAVHDRVRSERFHPEAHQLIACLGGFELQDRKSTRLNSSHGSISYAVF